MKLLNLTVLINPADLAPWNGADVPVRFIISDTKVQMEIDSPPAKQSFMERLRMDFAGIESHFSGQSLDIMSLILATASGEIARKILVKQIWHDYIPSPGRIRNAIWTLNQLLEQFGFGHRLRCYRKGLIRLEPFRAKSNASERNSERTKLR